MTDDQPLGDWTRSGLFEVSPGVYRAPMPLPNDSLRAVNVYVVVNESGLTLIDSGWAIVEGRRTLEAALARMGAEIGDIDRVLVTHVHRDHYTLALELRRAFGTRVELGQYEKGDLDAIIMRPEAVFDDRINNLRRLGSRSLADRMLKVFEAEDHRLDDWEYPDVWLKPGARSLPGGRNLEVIETPGHTSGHVVFADTAAALMFAGDHVLSTITPSIGFEVMLSHNPLGAFLSSLAKLRARPDATLLPAHGPTAASTHARIDELVAHHEVRLQQSMDGLLAGASTGAEVARTLKWTRHERGLDELDEFNQLLAVSETGAHLDLLVAQGRVRCTEAADGLQRFEVVG